MSDGIDFDHDTETTLKAGDDAGLRAMIGCCVAVSAGSRAFDLTADWHPSKPNAS
jgi:hypothetical protein